MQATKEATTPLENYWVFGNYRRVSESLCYVLQDISQDLAIDSIDDNQSASAATWGLPNIDI
jgi:hypothetical protein